MQQHFLFLKWSLCCSRKYLTICARGQVKMCKTAFASWKQNRNKSSACKTSEPINYLQINPLVVAPGRTLQPESSECSGTSEPLPFVLGNKQC